MTRVTRIERLRELERRLEAARELVEEIQHSQLLARLMAEEPQRWNTVYLALRLSQNPSSTGGVVGMLVALHDALVRDS